MINSTRKRKQHKESTFLLPAAGKRLIETSVSPITEIEELIIREKSWVQGALWGEPRPGHPEGKVIHHIKEVLGNVDLATSDYKYQEQLRQITIIHDTFKYLEEISRPRRDWTKHHAVYARRFAEQFIDDDAVLDVIEWHDEAFYTWRYLQMGLEQKAEKRLAKLYDRIGDNMQLFYLFFKCDTQTGDKYQQPVAWFEENIKGIDIVDF
ncbi:MAG: hypothetical protein GY810_04135 [Aureispira sp.]|nr:hypothetical protein [Aureispira sp.]